MLNLYLLLKSLKSISINPALPAAIVFLICESLVFDNGNFPLNDDWAYAFCIKNFLSNGTFSMSFWQAIPALPQIGLGILFTKLFGFSFGVLRITSVLISFITVLVFGNLLRKFSLHQGLTVALNLLFVLL